MPSSLLANGTGPFIGGLLVQKTTWRWTFWLVPMLAIPAAAVILFFLPLKHQSGNYAEKVKMIDYGGIALNLASVILILVRDPAPIRTLRYFPSFRTMS